MKTWEKYFEEIKKPIDMKEQDKILNILNQLKKNSKEFDLLKILEECSKLELWNKVNVLKILEKLKYDGILYEPRLNIYRFLE